MDQPSYRWLLLGVLCACAFVFFLPISIVSPLLVDLANEFHVSVAQAGVLVTLTAAPVLALALLVGPLSDAYGRRLLLLGGTAVVALSSIVGAVAPSYEVMAATRLLAGVGGAAVGPTVFAAVGDLYPYGERGRAYGYLIAANTLSMLVGIPIGTLLAGLFHWRWSFAAMGLVSAVALIPLVALYRPETRTPRARAGGLHVYIKSYLGVIRAQTARAVLTSSLAMSIGWMAFQTYLGALLITFYGIGTRDLAPIFGLAGLGTLIGSQIGARLGDRIGHKPIMSLSVVVAGALVLVLGYTATSPEIAGLINFGLSVPMGMRFTSASTIISEAVPTARATMNAANQSVFSVGSMLGPLLGGLIVETAGYGALSLLTAAGCVVSASVVALFVVEHRPHGEVELPTPAFPLASG